MPVNAKRLTVSDLSRPLPRLTSRKDVRAAEAFVGALNEAIRLSDNRIRRARQANKGYAWKALSSLKAGDVVIRKEGRYKLLERPRVLRPGKKVAQATLCTGRFAVPFAVPLYWSPDRTNGRVKVAA
jgi:hypothetical protein